MYTLVLSKPQQDDTTTPSQLTNLTRQQMIDQLNALTHKVTVLEDQVEKLKAERKLSANIALMREYCDQEVSAVPSAVCGGR